MEWRTRALPRLLFALPFLVFGVFAGVRGSMSEVKDEAGKWAIPVFSTVFCLTAFGIGTGRRGVALDRAAREVTTWWGFVRPWRTRARSLDEFEVIRLDREVRRSNNSSYTVFPVRLSTPEHRKRGSVAFAAPRKYAPARELAETIAKFLDLPLEDASSGTPVRRDPETLDESVRERFERTGERVDVPPPPPDMRSTVEFTPGRAVIEIPAAGLLTRRSWRVEATPEFVELRAKGLLGSKTTRLDTNDIEELEVEPPGHGPKLFARPGAVRIRTDRHTVRFGRHLESLERAHLHGILQVVITS